MELFKVLYIPPQPNTARMLIDDLNRRIAEAMAVPADMLRNDPNPWPRDWRLLQQAGVEEHARRLRPIEGEYAGSGFCRRWVGGAG